MLNTFKNTKLSSGEVVKKAKEFFGEKGLKMELTEEKPNCLNYTGGGGYVNLSVCEDNGKNRVDIVTVEWEDKVKKFLSKIK